MNPITKKIKERSVDIKLSKNTIGEYFSQWRIKVGEEIENKAEKENWDAFDYTSAINFMLNDIEVAAKEAKELLPSLLSQVAAQTKKAIMVEKKTMEFVNCSKHNLAGDHDDYSKCEKCHWRVSPQEAEAFNSARSQMLANYEKFIGK